MIFKYKNRFENCSKILRLSRAIIRFSKFEDWLEHIYKKYIGPKKSFEKVFKKDINFHSKAYY